MKCKLTLQFILKDDTFGIKEIAKDNNFSLKEALSYMIKEDYISLDDLFDCADYDINIIDFQEE